MSALTEDRNTPKKDPTNVSVKLAAAVIAFAGGICMVKADGYGKPGTVATGETYVGRFNESVDNSAGANGDLSVNVERKQAFKYANSSGDAVGQSSLYATCYVEDDQTVSATDGTGTRSACGTVVGIDSDGVWVE